MKTLIIRISSVAGLVLLLLFSSDLNAQDSISQRSQMLDVKLQLLDSKLDLLDTKIKLWESKPKELDIRLNEIDNKVKSMDFDPVYITRKITEMDSALRVKNRKENEREIIIEQSAQQQELPLFIPEYNSAIMLDPVRLLEGTFYLSYERKFRPALSPPPSRRPSRPSCSWTAAPPSRASRATSTSTAATSS